MSILNYWMEFEHTGRVEDYLTYLATQRDSQRNTKSDIGEMDGVLCNRDGELNRAGADPYAGIYMCNRDDIETDGCGRV